MVKRVIKLTKEIFEFIIGFIMASIIIGKNKKYISCCSPPIFSITILFVLTLYVVKFIWGNEKW